MLKFLTVFILGSCLLIADIVPFHHRFGLDRTTFKGSGAKNIEEAYYKNHFENVTPSLNPRIPKLIHHIWLGPPLPNRYKKYIESWKKHHPDWTVKLWTDKDLFSFPFLTDKKILQSNNHGQRSDIFRYEILYRYGGLYVDTDFLCLKPHDILHHTCDFYASMAPAAIYNGLMACAPKHPIVLECLKSIERNPIRTKDTMRVMKTTGPYLLTKKVLNHLENHKDHGVIIYHPDYFYAFPSCFRFDYWDAKEDLSLVTPFLSSDAFAVHLWATSWAKTANCRLRKILTQEKQKYIKAFGDPLKNKK